MTQAIVDHPNARMPARWLPFARIAWLILSAMALYLFAASVVAQLSEPLPVSCVAGDPVCDSGGMTQQDLTMALQLGIPAQALILISIGGIALSKLGFVIVGLILFWRKSDDVLAFMLALTFMLWTLEGIQNLGALQPLGNVLYGIASVLFVPLLFIFPDGRFALGWTRWAALGLGILFLPVLTNWLGEARFPLLGLLAVVWIGITIYSAVYRYTRISSPAQRQQSKWALVGIFGGSLLTAVSYIGGNLLFPAWQPSPDRVRFLLFVAVPLTCAGYILMPSAIAFAVFRYRLWDIDVLLRRTVTYAIVSGALAVIYFGANIVAQGVIGALGGQRNEVAIVASTLAVAALFSPVRSRIQSAIDRRFNRQRYDADRIVADFAEYAARETDLAALQARIVGVVAETIQPRQVTVWVRGNTVTLSERSTATLDSDL